jgi:hypothetical protein
MRRFRWILLIAELVMLAVVAVVPPVDLPQTAFDEADTPINQATVPVVLSCRLALTGLHSAAVSASPRIHPQPTRSATVDFHPQPSARSRSLLTLLCSFLC